MQHKVDGLTKRLYEHKYSNLCQLCKPFLRVFQLFRVFHFLIRKKFR